jgi:vitamin B12 transporter
MIIALLLAADDVVAGSKPSAEIVVTASRVPEKREETAASVDIIGSREIARLGHPLIQDFLRLTPSSAVSSSGPMGTFTQIRIRGAEANHTLLFIDGIKANDLSFGDEPRFELLNADLASRIEVLRGPQSALWGSQAIGGVVAVDGSDGASTGYSAFAEGGSFGFLRSSAAASLASGNTHFAGALGWQRATGIDLSGTGSDRDGYHNLSARAVASWEVSPGVTLGINGFTLNGYSEFDGNDPFTFLHTQDLATRFGMAAGRLWSRFGSTQNGLGGSLSASILNMRNHNLFQGSEISQTTGNRLTVSGQAQYGFAAGSVHNELIAAGEYEDELFKARDSAFGGLSNQDNHRRHGAVTGEWKGDVGGLRADVALRRDFFSGFEDATTLRASLLGTLGGGFSASGSYAEGIAPPTLTELFGFFPGSFVGNASLKPESSRGFEVSVRYRHGTLNAALTAYRQRLHDEIATIFNADLTSTSINRIGESRRAGAEAEVEWNFTDNLHVSANYTFLKASELDGSGRQVAEIRRPRHSGSVELDGTSHKLNYGASIAYVGTHTDMDFDLFPAPTVRLGSYWLVGARVAYEIRPGVELFARGANLLNQEYQDVLRYHTEGRAIYTGLRVSSR